MTSNLNRLPLLGSSVRWRRRRATACARPPGDESAEIYVPLEVLLAGEPVSSEAAAAG